MDCKTVQLFVIAPSILNRSNDLFSPFFFPLLVTDMPYNVAEHCTATSVSKMILNVVFALH